MTLNDIIKWPNYRGGLNSGVHNANCNRLVLKLYIIAPHVAAAIRHIDSHYCGITKDVSMYYYGAKQV